MKKFKKFLNSPIGSIVKVALSVILGHMLLELKGGKTIDQVFRADDFKAYGTILATSMIPLVINWFNSEDPRYGNKPKAQDFPPQIK
jgi:hypothetical protein